MQSATGTIHQGLGSGTVFASHQYETAGEYTATTTVEDNDGGIGIALAIITVVEVDHFFDSVTIDGDQSVFEGETADLSGSIGSVVDPAGDPRAGCRDRALVRLRRRDRYISDPRSPR